MNALIGDVLNVASGEIPILIADLLVLLVRLGHSEGANVRQYHQRHAAEPRANICERPEENGELNERNMNTFSIYCTTSAHLDRLDIVLKQQQTAQRVERMIHMLEQNVDLLVHLVGGQLAV